jgi:hypothetical protein
MLRRIGLSIIALAVVCGLTYGEDHTWSLVDIERTIPYSVVLKSVPGLTQDQYATASVRIMLLLNGDMSLDKLLALSADEPLVVRASIAIADALIAETSRQLKLKPPSGPSRIAGLMRCHPPLLDLQAVERA